MSNKNIIPIEINEENLNSLIYIFRGKQVMLDADLAAIYGYSTKDFNRQVKNNIERFDEEDLMFQLTNQELSNLRCKISTSSSKDRWGGRRYAPYAFTEQGIYMLMTVLKGPLAVRQSKTLVKLFKQMKDFIVQNQPLLGQREFLQLSLQTTDNVRDIIEIRDSLADQFRCRCLQQVVYSMTDILFLITILQMKKFTIVVPLQKMAATKSRQLPCLKKMASTIH